MEKKLLLDWLTFTVGVHCLLGVEQGEVAPLDAAKFRDESILAKVCGLLGFEAEKADFVQRRGFYGYDTGYICDGIRICWGNCDTVMVDLSGEGCRLLESLVPELDWLALIRAVEQYPRRNFSRMDIACDTFGELRMQHLFRYSEQGRYISRWKLLPRIVKGREETIDFGSPQSRTMLRIYNKTLERQCKVDAAVQVPVGWVRCELQFRNDAVDSFIREWRACGDVSAVYFGIMANQLRFVKERPSSETNLERLQTVAWWRRFLDNSQPIRLLYKGGLAYNLQSLERYLYVQAGSSLKTWLVLSDWDVDKMLDMVSRRDMNERQQALVRTMSAAGHVKPADS